MQHQKPSWLYLLLLILSGEAIFILPFVLPRVFRPTVLASFQLDNTDLGLCFSVYGLVAMVSYFFGGPLADKYEPRKLISAALWLTAVGGFVFAQFPGIGILRVIYGWWGFTTIFLFWAPMIKATRLWGGQDAQGKAFGVLDGGRGLIGALFGLLGVFIFTYIIGEKTATNELGETQKAFQWVIYTCSLLIIAVGVFVWFFMKPNALTNEEGLHQISLEEVKEVLKLKSVWLLMVIICCGYAGYKVTDYISQFADEVMGYDQVQSAQVGTLLQFLRPAVGISIGVLADRLKITRVLTLSFVVIFFGGLLFASGIIEPNTTALFFLSVILLGAGVYAARALYFGVMQIGNIPIALTGTAVGLISLVGYTPDIFASPLYGLLLDLYPGEEQGHQLVFLSLSAFSLIGGVAALIYHRRYELQ